MSNKGAMVVVMVSPEFIIRRGVHESLMQWHGIEFDEMYHYILQFLNRFRIAELPILDFEVFAQSEEFIYYSETVSAEWIGAPSYVFQHDMNVIETILKMTYEMVRLELYNVCRRYNVPGHEGPGYLRIDFEEPVEYSIERPAPEKGLPW